MNSGLQKQGSLPRGFEAVPLPQTYFALFHHRRRSSSPGLSNCRRSSNHHWSRGSLDLSPWPPHLGLAYTWTGLEQSSRLRVKSHLERL